MHLAVLSCPIRSALLGCRVSSCTWTSLAVLSSPSSTTHRKNPCQKSRYTPAGHEQQQRRAASSTVKPALHQHIPRHAFAPTSPSIITQTTSSIRHASSTTSTTHDTPSSPSSSSTTTSSPPPVQLDWNSFFTLRASRRKYSLVSSILASLTTTAAGAQFIASQNFETMGAQIMGFDPFIVLGLTTIACGAAGWLAGPVLGNAVWGVVYRKYKRAVAVKEKEFYYRIKRFRVDPSANSFANPVPDYYGEKIGSVQGYRQWLKDQRAYNRKKRNFV
ncbi:TIM23 complex component [Emydomyces testavorans]|uniref:Presequence translocated-associated motor subunit PAM17 n=1 Tax=Emydomyces testavorans TaxID=2070801 RepID=A0AAF0IM70_9EURO|nr:TIM23 complex component [Emydomyces testavorans]